MRRTGLTLVVVGAVLLTWFLLAAPTALGGSDSYVAVHGVSMAPRFHTGDLAIVRRASQYTTGDVVAYRSHLLHTVVMHRIVAVHNGHYTFKGDNNSWLDPEHPTRADLIGRLAVRVPQGGTWMVRLTSPPALAAVAFLLLSTGGTAAKARHRRRQRRKRRPMARHASPSPRPASLAGLPPQLRAAAATAAGVAVLGLALAVLGWSGPLKTPTSTPQPSGRSMTFAYTATVAPSPAYDTTTVTSPDPLYVKLTKTVTVRYSYTGSPGSLAVSVGLSTPGGWHSTVPLNSSATFSGNQYQGSVALDLAALEARAQAAAAATGVPASQVDLAVVASVTTTDGATFAPAVHLNLTPLQLSLAGDTRALTVTDPTTTTRTRWTPRTLQLVGHQVTAGTARILAAALLLASTLAVVALLVLARRWRPANEAAAIRARYAPLLVPIHPMPTPPGAPVVDVTAFATLARLAERHGLLIMYWTRSDVATFVLQDEATTYRYRSGSQEVAPDRSSHALDYPLNA